MTDSTVTQQADILLVEDNSDDRELTILALQANGLLNGIDTVNDGVEAVDYLFARGAFRDRDRSDRPRLILLDINMPRMSGLEVLRLIKADDELRSIPVVVLTSSREEISDCYANGANSYIVKPVEFDGFLTSMKTVGLYWLLLNEPPR